jgi:hypothetical protein
MWLALLLVTAAAPCPDAAVAEYELDYERAITAYEACAKTVEAPKEKAPLFVRIGVLQLEVGNESAARLVFRAALGYDPDVKPRDDVSPKSRAFFDEVHDELSTPAEPTLPPADPPKGDPAPTASATPPLGPWLTMAGGGLALVTSGALYGVYYAGARPPGPEETQREYLDRYNAGAELREVAYWSSLVLATVGVGLVGTGAWWAITE